MSHIANEQRVLETGRKAMEFIEKAFEHDEPRILIYRVRELIGLPGAIKDHPYCGDTHDLRRVGAKCVLNTQNGSDYWCDVVDSTQFLIMAQDDSPWKGVPYLPEELEFTGEQLILVPFPTESGLITHTAHWPEEAQVV